MERDRIIAHPAEFVQPYGAGRIELLDPPGIRPNALKRGNRLGAKGWKLVFARTVCDFGPMALMDRGATMTFYTITAFAPTLLAFYSLVTLLFPSDDAEVQEMIGGLINDTVPEMLHSQAFSLFHSVVGTPAQSTVALVISLLISLLSASAYVRAFSRSTNVIYGRMEGRPWIVNWLVMWGITVLLVLGAVTMLAALVLRESLVDAVLRPIAEPLRLQGVVEYLTSILLPVWEWARYPAVAVAAVVLTSCLFYFAPNVRPGRYRLLTFGAFVALVINGGMWTLFGWYLSAFGVRTAYGAFGTVLAVLMVVWVMNIVMLLGVKLDAEILRAKELQAGWDSHDLIKASPRAQEAVLFQRKVSVFLRRLADEVRVEGEEQRKESNS